MGKKSIDPTKKELVEMSDYIGSTSGIIDFATKSDKKEFIICTENGVRYELEKKNPEKKFYFTKTEPVCHDMKTNYFFCDIFLQKFNST